MKIVLQRVSRASVVVDNEKISEIGMGYVILLGVSKGDSTADADYLAEKIVGLRLFENSDNKFDKELVDIEGELLVVPQFTLFADCSKGKRPYFGEAEEPETAKKMYQYFFGKLRDIYNKDKVKPGKFGAKMLVEIYNDGPVTIILDSNDLK